MTPEGRRVSAARRPEISRFAVAGGDDPGSGAQSSRSGPETEPAGAAYILLVEDNAGDVLLVREALLENGLDCDLVVINDGEKAIDYLEELEERQSGKPGLVVLDLNLPKKSGREVLARMRAAPEWAGTPIVILSSSEAPDDREYAAVMGASLYIRKPLDLEQFMAIGGVLRRMLEGRKDASA
jgi:DNA-binding response OmpR family regulator